MINNNYFNIYTQEKCSPNNIYKNVHRNTICYSYKLKTTQMSINNIKTKHDISISRIYQIKENKP